MNSINTFMAVAQVFDITQKLDIKPAAQFVNVGQHVDVDEEFKTFMNKFVINKLLANTTDKDHFLKLIFNGFKKIENEVIQRFDLNDEKIKFIYKGGNLLRIEYKQFFETLRNNKTLDETQYSKITYTIDKFFQNDFSKSDDDFTFLIDPRLPNFSTIMKFIVVSSFDKLREISQELMNNKQKYFSEFYGKSKNVQASILADELRKTTFECLKQGTYAGYKMVGILFDDVYTSIDNNYTTSKSVESFINVKSAERDEIPLRSHRIDFAIINETNTNTTKIYKITGIDMNRRKLIYTTYNSLIEIDKRLVGRQGITKFVLNRVKINARLYLVNSNNLHLISSTNTLMSAPGIYVNAPGELIDITIPYSNDIDLLPMFAHGLSSHIDKKIFFIDNEKVIVYTYNLDYLIHNLKKMLFEDTDNKPWDDKKSEKRCRRLLVCLFFKSCYMGLKSNLSTMKSFDDHVYNIWYGLTEIGKQTGKNVQANMIINLQESVAGSYNKMTQNQNNPYRELVEALDIVLQIFVRSFIENPSTFDAKQRDEILKAATFLKIILESSDTLYSLSEALVKIGIDVIKPSSTYIYTKYLGGFYQYGDQMNIIKNRYGFLYDFINDDI